MTLGGHGQVEVWASAPIIQTGVATALASLQSEWVCDDALVRCERCDEPTLYFQWTCLADDERRHAALYRCPDCGSLYEVHPEVKGLPQRLSETEASQRYPGAL